jgi:hypothetical protein
VLANGIETEEWRISNRFSETEGVLSDESRCPE